MPFAYLLRCRDGTLYAGAAVDLERRLREHAAGRASRYTRARLPVELAWARETATWSEALREEARLKRLPKPAKEALVASESLRRAEPPARGGRAPGVGAAGRAGGRR